VLHNASWGFGLDGDLNLGVGSGDGGISPSSWTEIGSIVLRNIIFYSGGWWSANALVCRAEDAAAALTVLVLNGY